MHCTGFKAKVELEKALGAGCVPAGVGVKVVVEGDSKAAEEGMRVPVVLREKIKTQAT